jgi:hypothetical protein
MEELPSRRFGKPVCGRIVLKSAGPNPGQRVDYIEAGRGRDGNMAYVLNAWRRPGIPWVVGAGEVAAVEPFGRPSC